MHTLAARALCVVLLLSTSAFVWAADCPRGLLHAFDKAEEEGIALEEQFIDLAKAMESLEGLQDPAFRAALERFTNDVLAVLDNPVPGIPEPAFERTAAKLAHLLAGPADGRYSADHLRRALIAADGLRENGVPFAGLVERASTSGSSAWLVTADNRGHLFEVIAARRLLDEGSVLPADVRGLGFRVTTAAGDLEGDFVSRLTLGGEHWYDFKAADGKIGLDQIAKAEAALRSGQIRRFSFAYESGHAPTDPEVLQALSEANTRLASQGRTIELFDAGPN